MFVQTVRLLAFCLVWSSFSIALGEEEQNPSDIQGVWDLCEVSDNGQTVPRSKFEGEKFIITNGAFARIRGDGSAVSTYKFAMSTKTKPWAITITRQNAGINKTSLGVCRIEGETLRLCVSEEGGQSRLVEFENPDVKHSQSLTLRRSKEASPVPKPAVTKFDELKMFLVSETTLYHGCVLTYNCQSGIVSTISCSKLSEQQFLLGNLFDLDRTKAVTLRICTSKDNELVRAINPVDIPKFGTMMIKIKKDYTVIIEQVDACQPLK
jgi:uncharacterized protein (TIGR03067 family)